jgi:hypothetical protein
VLDYGPDEGLNQQALQAGKWNVVAFPNQVKVQFSCQQFGKTEFEGRDAFLAQIPTSLLRMQKREYYRVATPTITPLKCAVPLLEEESLSTVGVICKTLVMAVWPLSFRTVDAISRKEAFMKIAALHYRISGRPLYPSG